MTGTKLSALTKNSAAALVAAYSAPPMAGPIARLRFWLTAPSAIACVRSSGATSSGCSVCHVGEVSVCPTPTAKISASRTHGVTSPASASPASTRGREQHERLRRDQQPATIDEIADRARRHGEQDDRKARRRLDQRHQRRRRRQRQHQLLSADRLHPAADVADELRRGHPREIRRAKRRPRRRPESSASPGARRPDRVPGDAVRSDYRQSTVPVQSAKLVHGISG